jgi:hypothetical protein
MKLTPHSVIARAALATLFLISALFCLGLAFSNALAGSRFFAGSGSKRSAIQPSASVPAPFSGTYDPHTFPCGSARHHFTVPAGQTRIIVQTSATVPTNDISVSLLYGSDPNPVFIDTEDGGTSSEALIWEPGAGVPAGEYQVQICQTPTPNGVPQMAPFDYNGTFTYDNSPVIGGSSPPQFGPIAPAVQDTGGKIGYENFQPPPELVMMDSSSQGPSAVTVEYLGNDAGEPSMGVNWNSAQDPVNGITAFQADLQTVFVKFDDSCPVGGNALFYRSQSPTSQFVDSDPIGFVDRITGRVFCGQLTLLNPTCKISFTDTDGKDPLGNPGAQGWQGSSTPLGSGVDHQTIGGGPYHSPLPPTKPGYANAVYYASQDLVGPAFAFRSDDGGQTWPTGPVDMWTTQCVGLHGHLKVTPNTSATVANGKVGTVFVPNNSCGANGAVVVSETNGLTWSIRPIGQTTSNPNFQDPAISIDDNGRVYFAMSSFVAAGPASGNGGSQMVVAVSDDNGLNWTNIYDVGAVYGLKNVMYPAAVAGDGGRAAVAFFGSTVGGDPTVPGFSGVWHLYIAHTFDGGAHWTTTDATPNDPVQRGPIWAHGQADISRNMLDFFDMAMDKQGRVQVGFADGCADAHCIQANTSNGNAYTDRMTITRQSSGRRLISSPNPAVPAQEAPGMPSLSARRDGPSVVRLSWSEADPGTSPITKFQVLRGEAAGAETLLVDNLAPTQNTFDDVTATDTTKTYYYKVVAVNGVGASCGNNEVAAPYLGNTCTQLIVQKTPPGHPEQQSQGAAPPSLAIDHVAAGEPPGTTNFLFQMKVTNMGATPPPNSRWRIVWNSYAATGYDPKAQQFYVGMTTDENSVARFEWGTITTAVVGLVVGLPTETERGSLPNSNFDPDGTINLVIPKTLVGNPAPGDLLGAVNGRTFTGDTPETENLERSTAMVDHTFVKAQRDNGRPAATYTVAGNGFCSGGIGPISAVSRKTHGSAGTFDINLFSKNNIECRQGQGPNKNNHQVVITFGSALPITVNSVIVSPGPGKTGSLASWVANGNELTINLAGVANAQTLMINLIGVSDGRDSGDTSIPMPILLGDVNQTARTDAGDQTVTRNNSVSVPTADTFRMDVNCSGRIDAGDQTIIRNNSVTPLP